MNAFSKLSRSFAVAFQVALLILALASAGSAQHAPRSVITEVSKPTEVRGSQKSADLTDAPDSKLQQHLGERVTMHGKFSLRGKVGPFILVGERPIYLKPKESSSWNRSYEGMEGKEVRVIGILRFAKNPASSGGDLPAGRPSDHFYFEAESAKIKLSH
jgi:hypothetical protein